MKIFLLPLKYLIAGALLFVFDYSFCQSFSHPLTGVITGDVMHAVSGNDFIGVVYTRSGNVYYNQVNSLGVWGEESFLGAGSTARLAIDSNDNPHVVFTTTVSPAKIAYSKYDGSNWSELEYIGSLNNGGTGNCSKPDVAIANNGDVHITYTDSHGSTGDDYTHPDIMYAKKTTGNFNVQLIFRGYRDYSSSGSWGADYFSKGSYITVNESGDYFIIAHRQNIWRWSSGTDNTYFIMVSSNLGSGNISNYGSDIFTIHDLDFYDSSVVALYKQTAFKTSELTVSGTTISFTNTRNVSTSTSVSSAAMNNSDLVVGGLSGTNLFTQFNGLSHVYIDIVVKSTIVSVVEVDGVFYAVYTNNGDGKIKIREVAEPLSITRYILPGQEGPTVIDGQAGTVEIKVEGGTDLVNLAATFTTTSDVTGISVGSVPQTSGISANDFRYPVTYVLTDGVSTRDWQVKIQPQIMDTLEIVICEGDNFSYNGQIYTDPGQYLHTFQSESGSDSLVLLMLTVAPVYNHTAEAEICEGESYSFGTRFLTTAGEYTEVFESASGCDSTVILTLTVNPVYNHTAGTSICEGESYIFGTQTLSSSGEYTEVFESFTGCDSTVVLTLTVTPVYNHTDGATICQGEAYVFGTQNLTTAGEYTEVFESFTGCDSTVVLTLTVNPVYNHTNDKLICQGEIYEFGTQNLTAAGEYTEVFKSATGCDSTVILTLTVNPVYNHTDVATICQGETYVFGTQNLTSAGEYTEVFESAAGCDSTVILTLNVNPVYNHTDEAAICQGETYVLGTQNLTVAGEYTEVFESATGCDSTVVLTLYVNLVYNHTGNISICQGETYVFGTQTLTTAGEYTEVFKSSAGCDSTVVLTLTVNPDFDHTDEAVICQGETYIFGKQNLTIAGDYTEVFESATGCDSTVVLTLTVNPIYSNTDEAVICQGESYAFGTQNLTTAGEYTEVFESLTGCDSTVILTLIVNPVYNHTEEAVVCHGETYVFGTQTLTSTGEYTEVFQSATGCDSIVVLTLTVGPLYNHTVEETICQGENYEFGNMELTTPGEYTGTFLSAAGCDSLVVLTLSVNPVFHQTIGESVCQGEFYEFGGQSLTSSGEYTANFSSATGCDSTVVLTLSVNPVFDHNDEAVICQGETYMFGSQTLTSPGVYTETFESGSGCDSVVVLTLTAHQVYHTMVTTTEYADDLPIVFGNQAITEEGTYSETFTSVHGCDSTVTLTVIVKPADVTPPLLVCNPITVILNNVGQYTLTLSDIQHITEGTSDDNTAPDDLTITAVPNTFLCLMAGTSVQVTVTANDLRGNSSSASTTVSVIDQTPPDIACKNVNVQLDENGQAEIDVSALYTFADDACGIFSVTAEKTVFSSNDLGSHSVSVTAADLHNNIKTCSALVTITDMLPPRFNTVGDLVITISEGMCEAEVDYPVLQATDNSGMTDVYLIDGRGPGSFFPVGISVEQWVAVDASGNSDTLSFEVVVNEILTAPSFDKITEIEMEEDHDGYLFTLKNISDGSDCKNFPLQFEFRCGNADLLQSYQFNYVPGNDFAQLLLIPAKDEWGETGAIITIVNAETETQYSDTFNLRVLPVNDPPFLVFTPENMEIQAGENFKYYFNTVSGILFDDVDDENLQLLLKPADEDNLPGWLLFDNDTLQAFPAAGDAGCVNLVLSATDSAGASAEARFTLCVSSAVGSELFYSGLVTAYPNPTSGRLNIKFLNHDVSKVEIYNSLGMVIINRRIAGEDLVEIDMSGHISGIYILKATGNNYSLTRKIVLKKE
jgi:hypothetical protein